MPTQGYAYCSYQEKQQTAKNKERIDKLAAAQTAVNPFFNAIHCFSSMSKHAPHSSSSLYHPSNMKLLGLHIFCFLFIEKDEFNAKFYQVEKRLRYGHHSIEHPVPFRLKQSSSVEKVEIRQRRKTYRQTDIEGLIQVTVLYAWKDLKNGRLR